MNLWQASKLGFCKTVELHAISLLWSVIKRLYLVYYAAEAVTTQLLLATVPCVSVSSTKKYLEVYVNKPLTLHSENKLHQKLNDWTLSLRSRVSPLFLVDVWDWYKCEAYDYCVKCEVVDLLCNPTLLVCRHNGITNNTFNFIQWFSNYTRLYFCFLWVYNMLVMVLILTWHEWNQLRSAPTLNESSPR